MADLNKAIGDLSGRHFKIGRDRLERAETALLNREAVDLDGDLHGDKPLPATAPIDDIVKARAALDRHDLPQAMSGAKQALAAVDADLASLATR